MLTAAAFEIPAELAPADDTNAVSWLKRLRGCLQPGLLTSAVSVAAAQSFIVVDNQTGLIFNPKSERKITGWQPDKGSNRGGYLRLGATEQSRPEPNGYGLPASTAGGRNQPRRLASRRFFKPARSSLYRAHGVGQCRGHCPG